ncbi:MAG: ribosome-binding factor A [Alphaproteobacteria bacterium]|nr:ribosome-binding factor A [Alphaproteobacteria bacterium]MBN2779785.1 ribosome-binding factor A [Alphaproteobacteria bacterium]
MKEMTQRQLQVAEKIRRILSELWPSFDTFLPPVSLVEVQISPDLKNATIFYMANNGMEKAELEKQLKESVKHIRYELANRLNLRVVPRLQFREDHLQDKANHIETLLKETGDV